MRLGRRAFMVGLGAAAAISLIVPGAIGAPAKPKQSPPARFGVPTRVTPPMGYGYEPTVVIDRFNNIFATAHKENWQLVVAPDTDSPTYHRSMSWAWVSVDGGNSFTDIPGLTPLSLEQHEPGVEGDMVFDDADHLYFVDTVAADNTITRWTTTGHGLDHITLDFTRPIIPTVQPSDDRPWITAHGDGSVFYIGNEGNKTHFGGRYLLYQSYDGGMTFSLMPTVLEDSGWCRPAADHNRPYRWVYVICTNDEGLLYAYVSGDDGRTFQRSTIGTYNADMDVGWQSWPTPVVAPNGFVYFTFLDAKKVGPSGAPLQSILWLYTSRDHGKHWTKQDITTLRGQYEYVWMSVSPTDSKRLGLGVYYRPDQNADWRTYGAVWKAGEIPTLVSLDDARPAADASEEQAPGDYLSSFFGPDGRLSVVWTHIAVRFAPYVANREIYFVRSL